MGGFGSGRTGGGPTVEGGLTLDLGRMIRQGGVVPGRHLSGTLTWTRTRTGERIATIIDSDYQVILETTRPRFGGLRWWFICPLTGRRAAKLHLPPGAYRFACRQAYGLAYQSQRESGLDATHARQARIYRKLGTQYRSFEQAPPPRRKWMRRKTYNRLRAELEAAEEAHEAVFSAGAARIVAREDRLDRRNCRHGVTWKQRRKQRIRNTP